MYLVLVLLNGAPEAETSGGLASGGFSSAGITSEEKKPPELRVNPNFPENLQKFLQFLQESLTIFNSKIATFPIKIAT